MFLVMKNNRARITSTLNNSRFFLMIKMQSYYFDQHRSRWAKDFKLLLPPRHYYRKIRLYWRQFLALSRVDVIKSELSLI